MFQGVFTAIITPFTKEGKIDLNTLKQLVVGQINAGVAGLVPIGTTGESPTLNTDEVKVILEMIVQQVDGKVPIIAGTGSNNTANAIKMTQLAKEIGVDACLQVVPYYNKPTQAGLMEHFLSIANAVDLPIILYNVPGRSGQALTTETILKLAQHSGIVAVKEASGSINIAMDLIARKPTDFDVLSGDDGLTFSMMALGGSGIISVISNLFPDKMVQLASACLESDWDKARKLHFDLLPLFKTAFIETNPIPIKAAMAIQGMIEENYRLPMCSPSDESRSCIIEILSQY
jgi:4-hydroxy-tetrahydrodipicolinate synthase